MRKFLLLMIALLTGVSGAWADVTVTLVDGGNTNQPYDYYGSRNNGVTPNTFTTNANSGLAGLVLTAPIIDRAQWWSTRCLAIKTSAVQTDETLTLTAPEGYVISGFSMTAQSCAAARPYKITVGGDTQNPLSSTTAHTFTQSGLSQQSVSITIQQTSTTAEFFGIKALTVTLVEDPITVTYALYESDGETFVGNTIATQEKNSAISIPAAISQYTYYDYATEGTIGTEDCTIKVTRTLKSGYVISLDGLSNSKCYNIRNNRGTWAVGSGATVVNSTVELGLAFLSSDTKQQFAFITYEGRVYLYSVGEGKFAYIDGTKLSLTADVTSAVAASPVTFVASTNDTYKYSEPIIVTVNGSHFGVSTSYSPDIYKYQSQGDGGNCACIIEAGSFDATSALAALEEYFHPSYTVTYKVKDGSDNILFTSDAVPTTLGANITTLPAEYQLTNFYEYNTVDVTISASGNTDVVFTATPKAEPLVKYTADTSDPYYYNLSIRSKYMVYDSENSEKGYISLVNSSEPFNTNAAWAFIGEPYAGFKLVNKAKGTSYDLTYTGVVPGGNYGNNNIQFVDDAEFNNRYWLIDTNTNGLVLRMKENTNIYFHHDNSNNYLRTCSVSEWSGVHNDEGSTIVESTDEDVLFALNAYMQSITIGSGVGQCYSTDPGTMTDEDAISTIAGVNAVILAHTTAAYPDAYAALVQVKSLLDVHAPEAGFYRLKNVAMDAYLTATATSTYSSSSKYVLAIGTSTDAATVIRLFDKDDNGTLYMYNQGYGFGWTASSGAGGGVAWVTSSPDKYVHWFPGTGTNQIAFAICYGNGEGGYASYLRKGIHTTNNLGQVIAGTDDTIDEAQWVIEAATTARVELHSDGAGNFYATFCAPFSYTVSDGTTTAYTLAASGEWLVPTPIDGEVPAGTPVLLKGSTATATVTIGTGYQNTTPLTSTALTGTYLATTIDGAADYVLGKDDVGVVGFYHWDSNNLGTNRAYVAAGASVKGYAINWGDVDAIKSLVDVKPENRVIYNLAGQRVDKLQRGVNIVNGKKVIVK